MCSISGKHLHSFCYLVNVKAAPGVVLERYNKIPSLQKYLGDSSLFKDTRSSSDQVQTCRRTPNPCEFEKRSQPRKNPRLKEFCKKQVKPGFTNYQPRWHFKIEASFWIRITKVLQSRSEMIRNCCNV